MRVSINDFSSIQGPQEPPQEEPTMKEYVQSYEVMSYGQVDVYFTDHEGNTLFREFEFWDVWNEGESGEYSMFRSHCGEYAIYLNTSMGEATSDSKISEIEYIG